MGQRQTLAVLAGSRTNRGMWANERYLREAGADYAVSLLNEHYSTTLAGTVETTGCFIVKNFSINGGGNGGFHYDESLGTSGTIAGAHGPLMGREENVPPSRNDTMGNRAQAARNSREGRGAWLARPVAISRQTVPKKHPVGALLYQIYNLFIFHPRSAPNFAMKKLLAVAVIAALAGGGWAAKKRDWFGLFKQSATVEADDMPTAVAEKKDIEFSIQVSGDVLPDTQLDVKAEVGGRIKVLHVEPGDVVKAGDVLVEIDDTDILSEMDSAKTEIEGANLAVTKSERNFERAKDLFESKLISQEAFDNLSSELDISRNTFTKAEKKMQVVKDKLDKTKVLAPTEGTVLTVPVVEGQVAIAAASVNSGTTLMSIANLSKLIVETHVNQVDVSKLTPKQQVRLIAEALKDVEMQAELTFIAPVATIRSGIKGFTVRAAIQQATARMRPGMTVQMSIPVAHAEDAISVPVSAVFKGSGNSRVVYVRTGTKTEKRPVKIGVSNTENAQILQGLKVGEEILLTEPARVQKRS